MSRENIKLETLGLGVVEEKFQENLAKVISNILDPNTKVDKPRIINISVSIKPMSADRRQCNVGIQVTSKLEPAAQAQTIIYVGEDPMTGETASSEYNPQQMPLFPSIPPTMPGEPNPDVIPLRKGGTKE